MSFAAPLWLLALLAIPVVALLWREARRRRQRFAVRHPGALVVAGVVRAAPAWRRMLPPALLAGAAALLVVALARPQTTLQVPVERASVVLVTDKSGSMAAEDVQPTRMSAAQDAAAAFLEEAPDSLQVGFVSYSGAVELLVEPTTDHDSIRAAVASLQADGGTATGDALDAALDRLQSRRGEDGQVAPAAIVLLSDGKTTDGADPIAAAQRAKRLGIPISTVALGTDEGTVEGPYGQEIPVPPDPETLRRIARTSGGQAYEVADAGELDRIYEGLGSRIGTKDEEREITAAFAAGGLLLLLGGLGTSLRWRGAV